MPSISASWFKIAYTINNSQPLGQEYSEHLPVLSPPLPQVWEVVHTIDRRIRRKDFRDIIDDVTGL